MLAKRHAKSVAPQQSQPRGGYFDAVAHAMADMRVIDLCGEVDGAMAQTASIHLRYFLSHSRRPITIYLNTPGGSVTAGLAIYDAIASAAKHASVSVIASGACMSMGTIIMQAATKRLATPNTYFLLHELSSVSVGSLGELRDKHQFIERQQKALNNLLSARTGHSPKRLKELFERKDFFIDAAEAVKQNIVDGIISA